MWKLTLIFLFIYLAKGTENECKKESGCVTEEEPMEYRYLGPTGLLVSVLGYGNMHTFKQVGVEGSFEIMKFLFDKGVNFYDTAEVYDFGEAESILGQAIQIGIQKEVWKRSDLVITTKIFWGPQGSLLAAPNDAGLSRKHIIEGTINSLSRLQLDYVDVLFCHRNDFYTPMEEIVRAMDFLVNSGKVFYWGTSEWTADRIREAHQVADRLGLIHPIVEQPEYSLLARGRFEKEYAALYANPGLGTTVWGVLAGGILTGKYVSGIPEGSRLDNIPYLQTLLKNKDMPGFKGGFDHIVEMSKNLKTIADEVGCSVAQLATAWVLKNPAVSTILMGGKIEYLQENLDSLKFVRKLTPEILEKIESIVENKPIPEFDWKNFFNKK